MRARLLLMLVGEARPHQFTEASERPGRCSRNVETTGARVLFAPGNISTHFCMLFLFVVMLPTYS